MSTSSCRPRRQDRSAPRGLRRFNGSPAVVQAISPIDSHERATREKPACRAIEDVVEPVAIGPEHHLELGVVPFDIGQDRDLHRVVVVRVIRGELEMPPQLARVGIQRDHRARVEIVTRALCPVEIRTRIADAPVRQVELRVIRPRHPDRTAAVTPGLRIAVCGRVRRARQPGLMPGLSGPGIV